MPSGSCACRELRSSTAPRESNPSDIRGSSGFTAPPSTDVTVPWTKLATLVGLRWWLRTLVASTVRTQFAIVLLSSVAQAMHTCTQRQNCRQSICLGLYCAIRSLQAAVQNWLASTAAHPQTILICSMLAVHSLTSNRQAGLALVVGCTHPVRHLFQSLRQSH